MHKLLPIAFLTLFLMAPMACLAQRVAQTPSVAPSTERLEESIAAVVNDSVVTKGDVEARMSLAMASSGLQDSPELRKRLMPQVLRGLIDEQLQLQEAKRMNIAISAEDIEQALKNMARDNNIPGGDLRAFLKERGVPPAAIEAQARANLAWIKVVQRELRPRVEIGDDEVDAVIERMQANAGKKEYLLSEIFITVEDPAEEEQARDFTQKLKDQLGAGGAFGAMARQFSQGVGAANGGDIGWVQLGQMAPEIDQALESMDRNQIAGPIRSAAGYHIIGVRDVRTIAPTVAATGGKDKDGDDEMTARLMQLTLPYGQGRDKDAAMAAAEKMRGDIKDCADVTASKAHYPDWDVQDLGIKKVSDNPPWLQELARTLKIGEASQPIASDTSIALFLVCERTTATSTVTPPQQEPNRAAITNSIGLERLENLARRLLRDLKKTAYIDVRL